MINFYSGRLDFSRRSRRARAAAFLGILLAMFFCPRAQAVQSLVLGWDASDDPTVIGYHVYYGGASGNYINVVTVGDVTDATLSGLVEGATYYFVVTAVNADGAESGFSNEASYTVPDVAPAPPGLKLTPVAGGASQLASPGIVGHTYAIQASTDLQTWTTIGSQTVDASGGFQFTDNDAPNFPARFYRTLDTQP